MVMSITGALVQSYNICKRQAWLMAHQIIPDQEHPFIEIGRLIDEESNGRDKKKVNFENIVLDLIRSNDEDLLVGEVKKSSRAEESARMQLAFYLYKLKQSGINARGILLFPEERKRVMLELTPELENRVEEVIKEIEKLILKEMPPPFKKIRYCKNCGYKEFCWS
ncbi:MAG: CRISPR-associated exonuclease Cas4 [Thermosediminibacterales bacterium]|nr:CRISPR-associated exonuclease Cas4 [Thermosediminibacterales bacterium]